MFRFYLLIGLMTLLVQDIFSQNTSEFAPIGAVWHYHGCNVIQECSVERFEVMSDTIIQNRNCRVVKRQIIRQDGILDLADYYLCPDGEQVYHYVDSVFYLLYDFAAEVGDTWDTRILTNNYSMIYEENNSGESFIGQVTVTSIEMIEIDGQLLKKQHFEFKAEGIDPTFASVEFDWAIEKLGSNYMVVQIGTEANVFCQLNCYSDSQLFYKNPNIEFGCEEITNVINYAYEKDAILYPNPNKDGIFYMSNIDDVFHIEVVASNGKKVYEVANENRESNFFKIKSLYSGLHFVKIIFNDGSIISKSVFVH